MQIVILCGGLATHLRPITEKIPKSMIEITGKPFLEHQLELLKKNGVFDIILCIGYKGAKIKKYFGDGKRFGVRIKYSKEKEKLLGTGGALKKAKNLLNDVFLVMYGDSYLPFDFGAAINYFKKFEKLGLMVVFRNRNRYEKSNVLVEGNLVKRYDKENQTKEMEYIDYGLSIFRKKALKFLSKDTFCDLSHLHKALIKKEQLLAFESEVRFYTIGSFQELEEFKKYIKNNL